MGKSAIAAVALAGAAIALVSKASKRRNARRNPDCSISGELDGVKYIEHVTGGADPKSELPMVIVFHSLTATPQQSAKFENIKGIRVISPFGPYERGNGYSWFNTKARGDQVELVKNMKLASDLIVPFLQDIVLCRPTVGLPVVTGSSQGGHMSYLMATVAKEYIKAAVAVSGWLPKELWNSDMAETVGIHGTRDVVVDYMRTKGYADAIGFPFYSFDAAHEVTHDMSSKWSSELNAVIYNGK